MSRNRITTIGIITIVLAVVLVGLFLFPGQSEDRLRPGPAQGDPTATNLGLTYLPISPRVSAYYDLGVDSGALITEVTPGSSADRAGVEVGDVILSFNGVRLEEEVPLLGMMMACPAGSGMVLEVWKEKSIHVIRFVHAER